MWEDRLKLGEEERCIPIADSAHRSRRRHYCRSAFESPVAVLRNQSAVPVTNNHADMCASCLCRTPPLCGVRSLRTLLLVSGSTSHILLILSVCLSARGGVGEVCGENVRFGGDGGYSAVRYGSRTSLFYRRSCVCRKSCCSVGT